jgi:hypothetical protein
MSRALEYFAANSVRDDNPASLLGPSTERPSCIAGQPMLRRRW